MEWEVLLQFLVSPVVPPTRAAREAPAWRQWNAAIPRWHEWRAWRAPDKIIRRRMLGLTQNAETFWV
jgi:hypothetical protein